MQRLESMDFYIDAGRFLNDYDRNNNFDLAEILRFFKPNNRLFGDYEIRRKNGWENFLDRKKRDGSLCVIPKKDIDTKVPDGWLLLFVISGQELSVNYGWIRINEHSEFEYDSDAEQSLKVDPLKIRQIYVLDPIKLKQISNLDEGRNKSFKITLLEYFFRNKFHSYSLEVKEFYYKIIDTIVEQKNKQNNNQEIFDYLIKNSCNNLNIDVETCDELKNLINAFSGTDERLRPLVKLKNFEKFKDVKIRLGQYEDGRYVIYLHPYRSEANCPGRIPAE